MGLAERQRVIALLSTDHALRERFRLDPRGATHALGLSIADGRALENLDFESIDGFGRSLWLKRRSEVENLLPLTILALGPRRWRDCFHDHAAHYQPAGVHKPLDDALAFVSWLGNSANHPTDEDGNRSRAPGWLVELSRFEAGFLRCRNRRLRCERFHYRVDQIAQALARGDQPTAQRLEPSSWPMWVFWVRLTRSRSPCVWILPR